MRHTGVLPGDPQLRLNHVSPGQFFTVSMHGSEAGEFVVLGRRQHCNTRLGGHSSGCLNISLTPSSSRNTFSLV